MNLLVALPKLTKQEREALFMLMQATSDRISSYNQLALVNINRAIYLTDIFGRDNDIKSRQMYKIYLKLINVKHSQ